MSGARESSVTVEHLRRLSAGVRSAARRSRVVRGGRSALAHSTVIGRGRTLIGSLGVAAGASTVAGAARALRRWGAASGIYTWLATPVETTEVVIDLRETYTVAPLIAGYEWLAPRVRRAFDASLARVRFDAVADETETRPVRAVCLVFVAALVTNTVLLAALGELASESLSLRAVAFLLGLAGVRFG